MDVVSDETLAALAGCVGGILLGLAARVGRFCTLGAIEDHYLGSDDRRGRMWLLALGVAIAGTFGLIATGRLDPAATVYLSRQWYPVASIAGGLTFGYGMALAGNCGYGALARLGGGDLRAFVVVIVMGVSAYMAMAGPTAPLIALFFPRADAAGVVATGAAHRLAEWSGLPVTAIALAVAAGLAASALRSRAFRRSARHVVWAVAVGLAIVSGWAATQWIADAGFDAVPVQSHNFSAPLGESLIFLMTSTGSSLSFGVGSVAGVLAGAFAGSVALGQFRWEACDDAAELGRQILGAFLMGTGAVMALGCSVGQALSAFSLLTFSGPLFAVSMVIGCRIGLRQLIHGFRPGLRPGALR